jgi:DUF1009 family protein
MKYGLIAGNGRFPILALDGARKSGDEVIVIAIKEEASPEVEALASKCYWISLGQLNKLIDVCHQENVVQIMMAGQVKHARIFSSIKPDWRLLKVLQALDGKNTDALIGAVAKVLSKEGIELVDSTRLLKHLLAPEGLLTRRKPNKDERGFIKYGRRIAHTLATLDLGQSVAIADRACVAIEAMEGTDAMLRRAASLVEGSPLTLVKSSSRRRHLLFDVPVIGARTIEVMRETNTTALAIDSGRTLMLDRNLLLQEADSASITIVSSEPQD